MYRIADVAEMFSVSPRTVRRWVDSQEIEFFQVGRGRAIRFSSDHIRGFESRKKKNAWLQPGAGEVRK